MAKMERKKLSRRGFLILLGTGSASLVLGVTLGLPYARRKIAEFVEYFFHQGIDIRRSICL